MSLGRKHILSLDENTIQFEIYEQEGGSIPTWLAFEKSSAMELYGMLRRDREFIWNMNFAHGDYGTHVIWDDMEGFSVHLLLSREQWSQFLYFATLRRVEETEKINWIKEGF